MEDKYLRAIIDEIVKGRVGMHIRTEKNPEPQWYAFNGGDVVAVRALIGQRKVCPPIKLNCLEAFRQLGFIKGEQAIKDVDENRIFFIKTAIEYLLESDHKQTILDNMGTWLKEIKIEMTGEDRRGK